MSKSEGKSNNELLLEAKMLDAEYESIRSQMLKLHDRWMEIETEHSKIIKTVSKRLKGDK